MSDPINEKIDDEHARIIEIFKEQLLIVFAKRLGGEINIPVAEIDDTRDYLLSFNIDIDNGIFNFKLGKKQ